MKLDLLERPPTQQIVWQRDLNEFSEEELNLEWLVTNGLGGYASGTLPGVVTRRYHGYLIAALPNPLGRTVMLSHLSEQLVFGDGRKIDLRGEETDKALESFGSKYLTEFRLELGLPVWRYEVEGNVLEKRIHLPYRQNGVHVSYRLVDAKAPLRLRLRPSMNFRRHEQPVNEPIKNPYRLHSIEDHFEVHHRSRIPPLRLMLAGVSDFAFTIKPKEFPGVIYRVEESRGYERRGELWSPGFFQVDLDVGQEATMIASTEPWSTITALTPKEARDAEVVRRLRLIQTASPALRDIPQLILAGDQFVITPVSRTADETRAHASGDEVRTVIAGYHWFTDWGRDTMICLEGLTLATGRQVEAGYILRSFAQHIRDGLIPNLFPEGDAAGRYNTADATLWFFHAVGRYMRATNDTTTMAFLLPKLIDIAHTHLGGTLFGIRIDNDGLLTQGEEGYQLTWMDAKVGDWVVTPRRGKAVEINALWYNALMLLSGWCEAQGLTAEAKEFSAHADDCYRSFNEKFWSEEHGHLFDVVDGPDGNDAACRPNQLFAMSLDHPVLQEDRWQAVLDVVSDQLLTPTGLRTLSPDHPDFKANYYGDIRSRDAAYHQGTVWAWLIGPYVDAWLKVYPDRREEAARLVETMIEEQLAQGCIGSVNEVFDAEPPYTARGCIAQAWSVAELLRAKALLSKTID